MNINYSIIHNGGHEWKVDYPSASDKDVVYYIDMCPCDDMHNYRKTSMPEFVKEDTHLFDTKDAHSVVQVATRFGWAIVAKWGNNGSTRIYALNVDTIMDAVAILHGPCDSGDCEPAHGEYTINYKFMNSETDRRIFFGRDALCDMYED